jgi:hypothetical protein
MQQAVLKAKNYKTYPCNRVKVMPPANVRAEKNLNPITSLIKKSERIL